MDQLSVLRPIERRVVRMADDGVSVDEIALRFRRSPSYIERVIRLAGLPGRDAERENRALRPVERCVLRWLERGEEPTEIGRRLRRSAASVERIDVLAHYKLASL